MSRENEAFGDEDDHEEPRNYDEDFHNGDNYYWNEDYFYA
jgi:hypothetical protein